jgi:hypothetical protein
MTNPFANNPGTAATATAPAQPHAPADPWGGQPPSHPQYQAPTYQAPPIYAPPQNNGFGGGAQQQFSDAPSTAPAPPAAPAGDPFSDPSGQSGEKIADMLGMLVLCRPLEIIPNMSTENGPAENVVRCNIAILDHPQRPGHVAEGVLVFQTALKRDMADIFRDPAKHLLIGRVALGEKKGNKSAPYYFTKATPEEKALAKQFLDVVPF